eukprot:4632136-Pyramimonas_sp.AAC.1
MRDSKRADPRLHESPPNLSRRGLFHSNADLQVRPVVHNVQKRKGPLLERNIEKVDAHYVIEPERPGKGHPAVAAGTSPLGTLRALEHVPDPAKQ